MSRRTEQQRRCAGWMLVATHHWTNKYCVTLRKTIQQTAKLRKKQAAAGRMHPGALSRLGKLCDLRLSEPSISVTVSGKQQ